jgi:hypothetical protein
VQRRCTWRWARAGVGRQLDREMEWSAGMKTGRPRGSAAARRRPSASLSCGSPGGEAQPRRLLERRSENCGSCAVGQWIAVTCYPPHTLLEWISATCCPRTHHFGILEEAHPRGVERKATRGRCPKAGTLVEWFQRARTAARREQERAGGRGGGGGRGARTTWGGTYSSSSEITTRHGGCRGSGSVLLLGKRSGPPAAFLRVGPSRIMIAAFAHRRLGYMTQGGGATPAGGGAARALVTEGRIGRTRIGGGRSEKEAQTGRQTETATRKTRGRTRPE